MKEKKTFAWDTIMTLSLTSNKMTVHGTDIEVKWCPITKMWWEVQIRFCLTNLLGYAIIKIMKRDFWNGIRPLGHMTLLALSEDLE